MRHSDFEAMLDSLRQAGRIQRGELEPTRRFEIEPADVRHIRQDLGLSQPEFARMIGVSVATLRNWEQARRSPEGPARALLRVAAMKPEALLEALAPMPSRDNTITNELIDKLREDEPE